MTLHTVKALNGRAAVAEAKGDKDAARTYYESAAARAEAYYPTLAAQARGRPVEVFSIAVSTAAGPGTRVYNLLRDCASKPDNFFYATDSAARASGDK